MTTTTDTLTPLHDALDALSADQRRDATSILLGYLWSGADEATRAQALAAMAGYVR